MSRIITYRLEVSATMPIADSDEDVHAYTLETATSPAFKRNVEQAVLTCLRRMEQECNVELMDFTVEDE